MSPKTATTDQPTEGGSHNKDGRYRIKLPPFYYYILKVEAKLKGRSIPEEGGSLLSAFLSQREAKRNEMLDFNAAMMGISREQLIEGYLNDTIASDLTYTNKGAVNPDSSEFDIELVDDTQPES